MNKMITISTDPISDMLTRIRNAIAVNKQAITLPHSNNKETVAKILADYGYVNSVKTSEVDSRKVLEITINGDNEPAKINQISRISRPGRRVYVKADEIPTIKRGRGIVVISTSKGVMTGRDAKAQKIGGELICQVY